MLRIPLFAHQLGDTHHPNPWNVQIATADQVHASLSLGLLGAPPPQPPFPSPPRLPWGASSASSRTTRTLTRLRWPLIMKPSLRYEAYDTDMIACQGHTWGQLPIRQLAATTRPIGKSHGITPVPLVTGFPSLDASICPLHMFLPTWLASGHVSSPTASQV